MSVVEGGGVQSGAQGFCKGFWRSIAIAMATVVGLPWPDWEHETKCTVADLALVPLFAAIFPIVRFLLDALIFERVGRKWIAGFSLSSKLSEDEIEANQKKLTKFKESSWKCVYYLSAEMLALSVTYNEPWFRNTKYFWVGPSDHLWPNLMAKFKLKVLYAYAGGFYAYSIFALLFWETRRKDFGVSMSHHVATLILILFSYLAKLARAGSVILAVHDASDVFLEVGKLTKYGGFELIPSISFILFAISWFLLRLIIFPFVLIRSSTVEVLQLLDKEKNPEGPYLYYVFNSLLISLLVLHVYWWVLIWRMIVRQVQDRGKISDDVRSDSDSDDEDNSKED